MRHNPYQRRVVVVVLPSEDEVWVGNLEFLEANQGQGSVWSHGMPAKYIKVGDCRSIS